MCLKNCKAYLDAKHENTVHGILAGFDRTGLGTTGNTCAVNYVVRSYMRVMNNLQNSYTYASKKNYYETAGQINMIGKRLYDV